MCSLNFRLKLWAVLFISFCVYPDVRAEEKPCKLEDMPMRAQYFYESSFNNVEIKSIEFDDDDMCYEMELVDGTEIEFNTVGEWTKIDASPDTPVPQKVINHIPAVLRQKVQALISGNSVVELSRNLDVPNDIKYSIEVVDASGRKFKHSF